LGLWEKCLGRLEGELSPQQFNTWIRPLHAIEDGASLRLLAPNRFVLDWVNERFIEQINAVVVQLANGRAPRVQIEVGAKRQTAPAPSAAQQGLAPGAVTGAIHGAGRDSGPTWLNPEYTFDTFVAGKSNELARAASLQAAQDVTGAYNPLFIYGGVGLGKTHLMHAIGNYIKQYRPAARVVYLHSERYVADMVKALQHNTIDDFKRYYRSVDALLIDDIQFFAGKERSQEEFFHTFNALLEGQRQVVMTCDRYPKEVSGLEERLISRFGWGLTVVIEPPELETRVAILMSKAEQAQAQLPDDVAFFIAKRFRANIRELEGALRRVIANARFTHRPVSLDLTKEALRDLLALQDKLVSIENIQKTVADYYKMRVADLNSPRRTRNVARPRQVAMALAKDLTHNSLPEIGRAFGGRDHTTVLHACRKVCELKERDTRLAEEYSVLVRILTS